LWTVNGHTPYVQTPASCCPGRPAHSRSRAFFQAAATLALVAGGVSGSLSTQALAVDYINPLGTTVTGSQQFHDSPAMNFTNLGTITVNSNVKAVGFYGGQVVNDFTNSGTIVNVNQIGVELYSRASQSWANAPSLITNFTNSGTIQGAVTGVNLSNLTDVITTLTNTGTISGGIITGPNAGDAGIRIDGAGTIGTINNYGTIAGKSSGISNSGSIGTINLQSGSVLTGVDNYSVKNTGNIGAINLFNGSTINKGIFNGLTGTIGNFTNAITLNTLTNAGTITTLNNSGTIGSITNTGTIGSITNTGTIGTLNLLSGSTVTSGISNTGTINILNMTITGITCSNYDVAIPNITGNQPITVNIAGLPADGRSHSVTRNGRRASVDVSGFGANTNAIRHVSNSVGRLVNTNGVIQSIGAKVAKHNADPYAMTSDLCADGAPAQPGQIGNSDFWIRGFTGRNKADATASSTDYINTYSGGAIGIDRDWSEDIRGGVFIGSGNMNNSLGGGLGGTESDLIFAGTYATKTWGTLFAKVGLTGGRGSNTGTRNIAAGAPETATADYKNWYVSPEVSVGKVYDLGQHLGGSLSVTPVLSVRYVYASQDGYTETGATNNLTMNKSHSTTVEERAELKFSYATKAFNDYGVKVNASVGGIGQQNNGGAMSGTLLGAPLSFATPGDENSTGFVGGLGFEVNRGKYTFTASGDYVRLSGGNADLSANVVFSVKF